jgi:hypothetical protein
MSKLPTAQQIITEGQQVPEGQTSIESIVANLVEEESYNPYGIHKLVNGIFEILGVDKKVRPQMMYNYSRNGLLGNKASVVHEKSGKKINTNHTYTKQQVTAFLIKYVDKNTK